MLAITGGVKPSDECGRAAVRLEVDVLVEFHRRVEFPNSRFEYLFYRTISDHVLVEGWIVAEEAASI